MRHAVVAIAGRPALLNAERAGHWRQHRETTRVVRAEAAYRLLPEGRKGPMAKVTVEVTSLYAKGPLPDTAACLPAVKAVIDGAVDAKLLTDDGPTVVRRVAFQAPRKDPEAGDVLVVDFTEIGEDSPWW